MHALPQLTSPSSLSHRHLGVSLVWSPVSVGLSNVNLATAAVVPPPLVHSICNCGEFFVKITLLRRHFIYPWNGGSSRCLAWDGKLIFSTPSCHKWLWKYENLQTWKLPKKAGCDAFSQIQSHILRNLERKAGKLIYWVVIKADLCNAMQCHLVIYHGALLLYAIKSQILCHTLLSW